MTAPLIATVGPSPLWYLTRGTGLVSLVLLTATMALGNLQVSRWSSPRWPRFVTLGLHRNLSLLVLVVLAVHIITAELDPFAPVGWLAVAVPFAVCVPAGLVGPRHPRLRPTHGPGGHQPGAVPSRVPGMEGGPLGRLRMLANRTRARVGYRHRPTTGVGQVAHGQLCRGCGGGRVLAPGERLANRAGPSGHGRHGGGRFYRHRERLGRHWPASAGLGEKGGDPGQAFAG